MQIEITMYNNEKRIDIQVDAKQRIKTTLRVLSENIQELGSFENKREVRLKESGRRIKVDCTYEEAGIYTGAEVLI